MDKTGEILAGLTHIMHFFPVLLVVLAVWIFFRIRASRTARALNNREISKSIKKEIAHKPFARISFFACCGVIVFFALNLILGCVLLLVGVIWVIIVRENNMDAEMFNKFANFVFEYWYIIMFIAVLCMLAFIVLAGRGIYVNIVYRKKLKQVLNQ